MVAFGIFTIALTAVDLILGLVLAAGLPIAIVVVTLFGPTPEIVANFSLILALSFPATGASQAIALDQRRRQCGCPVRPERTEARAGSSICAPSRLHASALQARGPATPGNRKSRPDRVPEPLPLSW